LITLTMLSSVIARGKAAIAGTETEQRLAVLLYDDSVQVISSLELNQIASLTYHETSMAASDVDMVERIFENLLAIVSRPANYSVLSVQKALVVTKHVLLYGAQRVTNEAIVLGKHVEALQSYNTAILAQQQQGATGMMMRWKGGGVDQGGPVRELAGHVHRLLSDPNHLRFERNTHADPNSLVPVGSNEEVAFATDEVRLYALKKRMEEQQKQQIKSNLAKADGGFGGGYSSKDGKMVVGAAHGIEEMIRQAQKEQRQFSDEPKATATSSTSQFADYQAPTLDDPALYTTQGLTGSLSRPQQHDLGETDLLSLDNNPAPQTSTVEADLLDFGSSTMGGSSSGGINQTADLLGSETYTASPKRSFGVASATDLIGVMSVSEPSVEAASSVPKPSIMPSTTNQDPFAALDALNLGTGTTVLSGSGAFSGFGATATTREGPRASNMNDAFAGLGATSSTVGNGTCSTTGGAMMPTMGGISGLGVGQQTFTAPTSSSLKVSEPPAFALPPSVDGEDGFVMGGTIGSGLQPMGHAPAAPPPPPPGAI
jgi:hypothetical protein